MLIIFNDRARKEEIWRGIVNLETKSNRGPVFNGTGQTVNGSGALDGLQKGFSAKKWLEMFSAEKLAFLIPAQIPKTPK